MADARDPRETPDLQADERTLLEQFLEQQRCAVLDRLDGLTDAECGIAAVPGTILTVGGLTNHLAKVEDIWFPVRMLGEAPQELWASAPVADDPDGDFHDGARQSVAVLRERYASACERSRSVAASIPSLDQLAIGSWRDGGLVSLRWVLVHLIEETATHNGHADLLVDAIVARRA